MAYEFDQIVDRTHSDSIKWSWYGDALPLWVADMDFEAPPPVLAAIRERAAHGVFGYAGEPPQLREILVNWLHRRFDWTVAPDALVFVPGVVSAFNIACRAFCEPGEGVLDQAPVYPPMRTAPGNYGLRLDEMELDFDTAGKYTVDLDRMAAAIREDTRLFLLCSPHNPTGRVFSREELLGMAGVALRRQLVICSDEIHCDLVYSGYRHTPLAALDPEIASRTVTIMAPSKTFNVPGLGFSFAVIPDKDLRKRFLAAGRDIVPHLNNFAYVAAMAAYTECDGWLADLIAYLEGNREYLARYAAQNWPGVRFAPPEATYLAWLDYRAVLSGDPHKFFLTHARVALNEAAPFGPGSTGFARLNFGCPRSMLTEAVERMTVALRTQGSANR